MHHARTHFFDTIANAHMLATRRLLACAVALFAVAASALAPRAETRALLIGVDNYEMAGGLRGAVADAKDLAAALAKTGAKDITVTTNAAAGRQATLNALSSLARRTKPGDLVVIGFAGLGAAATTTTTTTTLSAGARKVLLLSAFDPKQPSSAHIIEVDELLAAVGTMDAAGATVLGVIDAAFGPEKVRTTDARMKSAARGRSLDTFTMTELKPAAAEAAKPRFARSLVMEAAATGFTAPEVQILGVEGWRGALSYAVARGIEHTAKEKGAPVLEALADYASNVAYQLSDERQDVALVGTTRSVKQVAGPGMPPKAQAPNQPLLKGKRQGPIVPIAAIDGNLDHFKGVAPDENDFMVVAPDQNPVVVWDPARKDVLVGGDVIANDVVRDEIPSIVDRVIAVRDIKRLVAQSPQAMQVLPSGGTHRSGQRVTVEIQGVEKRALVLFSIAGNGKVQLLYPIGSDPPIISSPTYKVELAVQEPYGADHIVAMTAPERMTDIVLALNRLRDRRASGQLHNILMHYAPANWRIGSVGIYTSR